MRRVVTLAAVTTALVLGAAPAASGAEVEAGPAERVGQLMHPPKCC